MMDRPDLAGEPAGVTFGCSLYAVNDYATEYPSVAVTWQVLLGVRRRYSLTAAFRARPRPKAVLGWRRLLAHHPAVGTYCV